MDLKLKGLSWVENVYQKFEAMCQDVDEIVNQDNVRYAENSVQTVGNSMKKLYSGLVKNILPPSLDPRHEALSVPSQKNVYCTPYTKPIIEIKKNSEDNDAGQSSDEVHAANPLKEQFSDPLCFSEFQCLNESFPASAMDPIDGSETDLYSVQTVKVSSRRNSDVNVEEHVEEIQSPLKVMELPFVKDGSLEALLIRGSPGRNNENGCGGLPSISPAFSFDDETFSAGEHVMEEQPSTSSLLEPFSPRKEYLCEETMIGRPSEERHEKFVPFQKNVDCTSFTEPTIEIERNPLDTDVGQSLVELHVANSLKEHLSCFSGSHCLSKPFPARALDPVEGSVADLSSVQSGNVPMHGNSVVNVEEHVNEIRQSPPEVPDLSFKNEDDSCEDQPSTSSILDSPRNVYSCEALMISIPEKSHANADGVLVSVPSANLCDEEFHFHVQEGIAGNKFVNHAECSFDALSSIHSFDSAVCVASSKSSVAEVVVSSSASSSSKSLCLFETSAAHGLPQIGDACKNAASGCNSCPSQPSQFPRAVLNVSCGAQVTVTRLASCSSMSRGFPGKTDDLDEISDPNMESIELRDKVKLEDGYAVMDHNVPCTLSCRAPKLRSYKNKIKEIFAARKRLVKEYELLSVLYGDLDVDCGQHMGKNIISSHKDNLPVHDSCDSGWELL